MRFLAFSKDEGDLLRRLEERTCASDSRRLPERRLDPNDACGHYEITTKKAIEQILKDIDRDYYMTVEEAREYGLVDQIFNKEMRSNVPPPA